MCGCLPASAVFELPLLLLGAFRSLIDELHGALAEGGHGEARPLRGFALQAIGPDGSSVSELGRRLCGEEMLSLSAVFIESFHRRLVQTVGHRRLAALEDDLQQMAGPPWESLRGLPGWMT